MSIEKYFNEKKSNKLLTKLAVTGLVVGTLATGMTACDNTIDNPVDTRDPESIGYPVTTVTPNEETTTPNYSEVSTTMETTTEATTTEPIPTYTEEQLEAINKLLETAYSFDHELKKNGIEKIIINYNPITLKYSAKFVPAGIDNEDYSNFTFDIDENTANRVKNKLMFGDLANNENILPESVFTTNKFGPTFNLEKENNYSINEYLDILTPCTPEKAFCFDNKEMLSDDKYAELNNYLTSLTKAYENGLFSLELSKRTMPNGSCLYSFTLYPLTYADGYRWGITMDSENAKCSFSITEDQFNAYKDFFEIDELCYDSAYNYPDFTYDKHSLRFSPVISDTLKKQLLNNIYNTLVEKEFIHNNTLEQ